MEKILSLFDTLKAEKDQVLSLPFIVWTIIFGIIISWVVIFYHKKIIGAFVRAIITAEAFDEQSAKTLSELNQSYNVSAVSKYRSSEALRRIVYSVDSGEGSDGKKKRVTVDENTRFYIPEAQLERAKNMYDASGSGIFVMIGGAVALIILGAAIIYFSL